MKKILIILLCSILCGCTQQEICPCTKPVGTEFINTVYHKDTWLCDIDEVLKNKEYQKVLNLLEENKGIENTEIGITYEIAAKIGLWVSDYYDISLNAYLEHMVHKIYIPDTFKKVEYLSEDGKEFLNRNLIYVLETYQGKYLDSSQVDVLLDVLYRLKVNGDFRYWDYNNYLILEIGSKNNNVDAVMWNEEVWRAKNEKENSTFNFFK